MTWTPCRDEVRIIIEILSRSLIRQGNDLDTGSEGVARGSVHRVSIPYSSGQ